MAERRKDAKTNDEKCRQLNLFGRGEGAAQRRLHSGREYLSVRDDEVESVVSARNEIKLATRVPNTRRRSVLPYVS